MKPLRRRKMVMVKRDIKGNYYLNKRAVSTKQNCKDRTPVLRDWWFVKWNNLGTCGAFSLGTNVSVSLPKELVGKRIRFKVEVLGDDEK